MAEELKEDFRYLFEVKASRGKGFGIFAKVQIPRGTRVLAESPLLLVHWEGSVRNIWDAFKTLSLSQKASYLGLHKYVSGPRKREFEAELGVEWKEFPPLVRDILQVFDANNLCLGVFLIGSRMNHSCTPNVFATFNPSLGKLTYQVVRDIAAGEELTTAYVNTIMRTKAERQAELEKWGVDCTCETCADPDRAIFRDVKCAWMYKLDQDLVSALHHGKWKMARQLAVRLAAMQQAEGFFGQNLSTPFDDAARLSFQLGETRMALLWAEKELEVDTYRVGRDHPDYKMTFWLVTRLRETYERDTPVDEYTSGFEKACTMAYTMTRVLGRELDRQARLELVQ